MPVADIATPPPITTGLASHEEVAAMTVPTPQPLWRFALIGLGPLGALAIFGLLLAFFQHMA